MAPFPPSPSSPSHHSTRFNRPQLVFGTPTDPLVVLIHARSPHTLDEIVPLSSEREKGTGVWDAGHLTSLGLLPPSGEEEGAANLALRDMETWEGLSGLIVQVTELEGGGLAVAIKFAHPLADAQTLSRFAQDWAEMNRRMDDVDANFQLPPRPFEPWRLDDAAAGDIDSTHLPSPVHVKEANLLKRHAFDYYASATPDCPSFMLDATRIPPPLASLPSSSPAEFGTPIPWSSWDWMAPVEHKLVHFSGREIKGMWEEAVAEGGDASKGISKLDALLSHVWSLIVRARGLEDSDEINHLNVTLGARPRLSPPLPEDFLGSPLFILPVSLPARCVASSSSSPTNGTTTSNLPFLSSSIRSTLSSATPSRLASLLHVLGTSPNLARHWDAFLGSKHTIVTSWLRIRMYDVDFGGGKPRLVDSLMPNMDGIVQVAEFGAEEEGEGGGGSESWWKEGASVSLHLTKEVMERLEAGEGLRRFR